MERAIPMVYRRAATAVAQCRGHLEKAKREMSLALHILGTLEDPTAPWPSEPTEREAYLRLLRQFQVRLYAAQEALMAAWPPVGR